MKYSRHHINLLDEALATLRESALATNVPLDPEPLHSAPANPSANLLHDNADLRHDSADLLRSDAELFPNAQQAVEFVNAQESLSTSVNEVTEVTQTVEQPTIADEAAPELSLIEKAALRTQQMKEKKAANDQMDEAETATPAG